MNKLVIFKLAKLLKEKGFDVEDKKHYQMYGSQSIPQLERYSEVRWNLYKDYYLAPTIAEVVTWLYEKHGIWISINREVIGSDEWEYSYAISYLPKEYKNYKRRSSHLVKIQSFDIGIGFYTGSWDSPNLAYEAAIEYTLTNLI